MSEQMENAAVMVDPGIKETKEILVAGIVVMSFLVKEAKKDGIQITDFASAFAAIQANPEAKEKVDAAIKDAMLALKEVKAGVSTMEAIDCAVAMLRELPAALKVISE